jgi:hypothetical protein
MTRGKKIPATRSSYATKIVTRYAHTFPKTVIHVAKWGEISEGEDIRTVSLRLLRTKNRTDKLTLITLTFKNKE